MANGNHITHTVSVLLNEGIIGKNMKYIQDKYMKYGILYSDIIHGNQKALIHRIKNYHVQSDSVQSTVQQIVELLSSEVPGFSQNEIQDIMNYLCTM